VKRILLCTDGSSFAQSSYHYTAWFALQLAARIDILYVGDRQSQPRASVSVIQNLLKEVIYSANHKTSSSHQQARSVLQSAQQFFEAAGLSKVNVIHGEPKFLIEEFPFFELQSDLIVLSWNAQSSELGHYEKAVERRVLTGHKPYFISACEFKPVERILLIDNGSNTYQTALQFLTNLPIFRGLELHIFKVSSKPETRAIIKVYEAAQQARNAGFDPICQVRVDDPKSAIAGYVQKQKISLVLIGACKHRPIQQAITGITLTRLLKSIETPVLVV